jgi:hypothetical protein
MTFSWSAPFKAISEAINVPPTLALPIYAQAELAKISTTH